MLLFVVAESVGVSCHQKLSKRRVTSHSAAVVEFHRGAGKAICALSSLYSGWCECEGAAHNVAHEQFKHGPAHLLLFFTQNRSLIASSTNSIIIDSFLAAFSPMHAQVGAVNLVLM